MQIPLFLFDCFMQFYIAEPCNQMRIRLFILLLWISGILPSTTSANPADSLIALLDSGQNSIEQARLRLRIASELSNTDISGAIEYARNALSVSEAIGSRLMIAESKLAIGRYYDYLGIMEESIDHLTDAINIFDDLEKPGMEAEALMLIGNAYLYLNQFETALKYYTEVSRFGELLNDTLLIISGINSKGAVYGNTGKMDSALILFRQAHELATEIESEKMIILTYFNMGDVNLYSGRIDDALGIFYDLEKNYDMAQHNSKHLSNLLNSMTRAFIQKGDLKWARRYSDKTHEALNNFTRITETMEYYKNLYEIDILAGNRDAALEHYLTYTHLNDSLNNAGFRDRLANLETYFDLRAKEGEIERLTLDNQLKDLEIRQRMIVNYGTLAMIILLSVIGFLGIRITVNIRKKNYLLEMQKRELETANTKIRAQSGDLKDKNYELESVIDELKATQQHLVQSEKMASLGTLTAGVAHEINNPLNFIAGGLGIIEEAETDKSMNPEESEERRQKALDIAFDGLERATGIVKALMTFSQKGVSKRIETDLNEIIDNTLLFLTSKLTPDIHVEKDYQLKRQIAVFPDKMHQVIMNVIDNAIFAVNSANNREKRIIISTKLLDQQVVLEISNNGPAIDEQHLNQLFDPFFTTRDPGAGTGLGLSISYNLVSEHEGTILAENRDEGVTFVIQLPA